MNRRLALLIIACLAVGGITACREPAAKIPGSVASLDNDFPRDVLVIEANDGARHEFEIYLALVPKTQQRGLMFVREMPDTTGMLFVYDSDNMRSMWMKNTYIPLDMVFATSDGKVSSVIHNTQPLSLTPQRSREPAKYVLELNAGMARRLGIGANSQLLWNHSSD